VEKIQLSVLHIYKFGTPVNYTLEIVKTI